MAARRKAWSKTVHAYVLGLLPSLWLRHLSECASPCVDVCCTIAWCVAVCGAAMLCHFLRYSAVAGLAGVSRAGA
jgi:hypothetical protein